jgi:hypothetical protein
LLIADFNVTNWLNWQIVDDQLYYYQAGLGVMRYHLSRGTQDCVFPDGPVLSINIVCRVLRFILSMPSRCRAISTG